MGRPKKYEEFANELKKRLEAGDYATENEFPSENQLGEQFGLSRSTVRKALAILKEQNIVVARGGKGYQLVAEKAILDTQNRDVALIVGINFSDWSLNHVPCLIYTLFGEKMGMAGYNLHHIQPDTFENGEVLIRYIESFPGNTIILSYQVISSLNLKGSHLLKSYFACTKKRIIMFSLEEPGEFYPLEQIYVDWLQPLPDVIDMLQDKGFKKIVFSGYRDLSWCDSRKQAFLLAMRKVGLWDFGQAEPCVPFGGKVECDQHGRQKEISRAMAAECLLGYLEQNKDVEAVVCANDYIIEEVYKLTPAENLPYLVGFDNSFFTRSHNISSVGVDNSKIADIIMDLMSKPKKVPSYIPVLASLVKR